MKVRALLELCRVSNLPTVWSNAVLGLYAGRHVVQHSFSPGSMPTFTRQINAGTIEVAFAAAIAMSLIYSAGMVMNDLLDREVDAKERPTRPIPSGRVTVSEARLLAVGLFAFGVALIGGFDSPSLLGTQPLALASAVVLVVLVSAYNMAHQRSAMAVLLMASCRAAVVFCCAFLGAPGVHLLQYPHAWLFVALPAATLFCYTLAISVVARREVEPGGFGGPKVIMNMIAAMPLLDAVWLIVMGLWPASLFCVGCAALTKLGHRKVAGS